MFDNDPNKIGDDEKKAEYAKLTTRAKELITLHKPTDIDTDKVLSRVGAVNMVYGTTRTTLLSAVTFIGLNARIVGLTKDQILGLVGAIIEETEKSTVVTQMAEDYKVNNEQYYAKKNASGGGGTVLPGDDNIH